jgi:hypothetical protein
VVLDRDSGLGKNTERFLECILPCLLEGGGPSFSIDENSGAVADVGKEECVGDLLELTDWLENEDARGDDKGGAKALGPDVERVRE